MGIWDRLRRREAELGSAAIAVVGAGYVGTGVVHSIGQSPGMHPAVVVNRNTDRSIAALTAMGVRANEIVVSDQVEVLAEAIRNGSPAVTDDAGVLTELPIDVVVEATGALDYGTETILAVLGAGKHVVSFNAEVDALLGWRLSLIHI